MSPVARLKISMLRLFPGLIVGESWPPCSTDHLPNDQKEYCCRPEGKSTPELGGPGFVEAKLEVSQGASEVDITCSPPPMEPWQPMDTMATGSSSTALPGRSGRDVGKQGRQHSARDSGTAPPPPICITTSYERSTTTHQQLRHDAPQG